MALQFNQPVPGAGVDPPLPVVVPVEEPCTYRELYSNAANNPPPDRTAGYLFGYRFTDPAGGVPTPAALRDQTVALSDRQPMAFLALVTGQVGGFEVVILHRLLRYMDAPGDDPTGLHDQVLGLAGDILPHQYPTVGVPSTAFHLVGNAVRVPTNAAMNALLPTWDDAQPVLGPYNEQDPETEVVRPRHIQLVPGRYAALLIHRQRVRPKQAYQEIVGAIRANNELEACQDVVTWLRAACTARGGGGAQTATPSVLHAFTPLHLPPEAYRYVTAKVQADLPALARRDRMREGAQQGDAAALLRTLGLTRAVLGEDGADEERAGGKAPKTIAEVYKETYTTLLRYCNVANPDQVAPVWARLANCHKSEQHTVLTQELHKVCMSRGLSAELYTPVITTTLKQMIVGFQFTGYGVDDLTSGCQPFLVSYAGSAHHYQAVAAASVGNQLSQGEQNASLADYRTIREKEKVKFPRDISEVGITLARYAVLCQCLFQGTSGTPHPFVDTMWGLVAGIQNEAPFIAERFRALARGPGFASTYHARIVRAVQVCAHEYMQAVATNVADSVAGVTLPDFTSLLQELKRGTFQNSTNWIDLPEAYLESPPPRVGNWTNSEASTAATTRTGVSTLTDDSASPALRASVTRIDNPSGDAEFAGLTLRPGGTRSIMREHRPPANDAGNEFCVAWWTKDGAAGRPVPHLPAVDTNAPNTTRNRKRAAPETQIGDAELALGKLATATGEKLANHGWARTINEARGKSNIAAAVRQVPHKASRLLNHLRLRGAAVAVATPPWGLLQRDEAVQRGAHKSSHGERAFVYEEMLDFCRQGYWIVVPYRDVRHLPNLRIAPLGVVPQRDRRPRLIVDYSFSGLNEETVPLAPREAMQFGRALQRVCSNIVHADPRYGPVMMAKIDIADGFYRVWIQSVDVPKLGVILPHTLGLEPFIAFPLALPMGWVESPPYFTALTETACDLANQMLTSSHDTRLRQPHRLEAVAATPPADTDEALTGVATTRAPSTPRTAWAIQAKAPVATVDVYVDDFLLLAQTQHQQQRVMRATLHSIDSVFRALDPADRHGKEPASVKKMLRGEASWSAHKRMLGWDINAQDMTLNLPPHRVDRLREVLSWLQPPRRRLAVARWHRILGELRSMSPALPGTRGLFSVLQEALRRGDRRRVRLTQHVYDTAADFSALVDSLADRPTRLQELVPTAPSHVGACDACQSGMGGVWLSHDGSAAPIIWRQRFAPRVSNALLTADNPRGTVTISDLELTGMIAHKDVLATSHDVRECTIWIASDNKAAVSWSTKGSSTSIAARAYLLRLNALHQRHHRYVARHHYIPGPVNAMADAASRRWDLSDTDLLTYFTTTYPQDATTRRVSRQRNASSDASWLLWDAFCARLQLDPRHLGARDPIPLLQLFAQSYRTGSIAPGRLPVRARTVEDAVRAVGQAYARMGSPDPRLNSHGHLDIRLTALYRAWARDDAPPSRVKPLPVSVVAQVWALAQQEATPAARAAAECLVLGFYFLLQPGEYLGTPPAHGNCPLFCLRDIQLWIGARALDTFACSDAELLAATYATLTFTEQKNGVRNETIGHGRSGHAYLCPVHCLATRVATLRTSGAAPATPLNAVRPSATAPFRFVLASDLTSRIRAAILLHPNPAYTLRDVTVRSTRAGGAMALLCAGVDSDRIRLVGRWRSDEMYRYLHVQAQPVMNGLAAAMLRGGSFRLTPS